MKVVIIGGGTAGITAAVHLRRLDEHAEIVVLEKSDEFAVSTCGLPFLLGNIVKDPEQLRGATVEQMKEIFRIDVHLKHEVVNIDKEKHLLTLDGRPSESYDKLLLATGAMQLRPDIDGILGDNIFTLRDLNSVQKIKDYYIGTGAKRVVILGGGDIGVELAEAFHNLKAEVTIVEASAHILPYLDKDTAALVQNHVRDQGVKLILNDTITEFKDNEIILQSGISIPYDMALIATGVKPDVKLPIMIDIDIGETGGIIVNKYMQTNNDDIYACGDNVEVTNKITGRKERWANATVAIKQARVAAENIAGINSSFGDVVGVSIVKVFDMMVSASGCNEVKLQKNNISFQKVHLLQADHSGYIPGADTMFFKLLFAPNGQILGIQGIGPKGIDTRIDVIAQIMKKGGIYTDLLNAEMAYTPPFNTAKDAVNLLGSLVGGVVRDGVRYSYYDDIDWSLVGGEIILADTRSPQGFNASHITNAINLPLATLRDNLNNIPRDKQIILYCNTGYGAYNAYCILAGHGFNNISLLSGSMDLYIQRSIDEES